MTNTSSIRKSIVSSTTAPEALESPFMILPAQPAVRIASVRTAFPDHRVDQRTTIDTLCRLFPDEDARFLDRIVRNSGVEERFLVPSVEQVLSASTFTERNAAYRIAATDLAARAATDTLKAAEMEADEVDVIIDVSCTGVAIPALDVELSERLGFRPDMRRIPITESGCAAGALALGIAGPLAQAGLNVLVVAVELCTLTLCSEDHQRANVVSSVIFGDGAAAILIVPGASGPRLEAVGSHLIPDSSDSMGFDIGSHGLRIQLKKELPSVLTEHLPAVIDKFLHDHGTDRDEIGMHLVHPGGRRILDAYTEIFGLGEEDLRWSREALRRYGNLSSASILAVIGLAMEDPARPAGDLRALVVGVGPGLSIELALLDWELP